MVEPAVILRPAARILVIDDLDRVLLFDTTLAYTRVWMTPGGGLNPGESYGEGAVRELWEETGLREVTLSPCVWTARFRFHYEGTIYDQQERYFVARVPAFEIDRANWEEAEKEEIGVHRWWSLAEIAASTAPFRPQGLAALLPPVLAGQYPQTPLVTFVEDGARVLALPDSV